MREGASFEHSALTLPFLPMSDLEIIYVDDPMCSWCWGFAPVLDAMRAEYDAQAAFRVVVGGLRPGPQAQSMDDRTKAMIRSHWEHVEEASGQPFNFAFFDREGFLYDTEPAARAVVAVRQMAPAQEFAFFKTLQRAFYAENVDITQEAHYGPLLAEHGLDETTFLGTFHDEATRQATLQDFAHAYQWGIGGFPSVVLRKADQLALLTAGYQPYPNLAPLIDKFFNGVPSG